MIDCEEKSDTENTWETCKSYFKEIYTKQKRHNKATGKIGFKRAANMRGEI